MSEKTEQSYEEKVTSVLIYIQNNLDGDLSLEKLAEVACLSPFHFHRIFSAYRKESIKSYIRRLRLNRAARDLSCTDLPIIQVAERAGYDTQQSFNRAFKEIYNISPKKFRTGRKLDDAESISVLMEELNKPETQDQYTVKILELAPITVFFVRRLGDYAHSYQAWVHLASAIGIAKIADPKVKKISIAYDTPEYTPVKNRRFDACVTADDIKDFKPKGKVGIQTLHGGLYAQITHQGPFTKIEKTYYYLFGVWLEQSRYLPDDYPNFMIHLNSPFDTPEDKLLTEIYLPIKRK